MPKDLTEKQAPLNERRIWGRRQNRPLAGERKQAMQEVFPVIALTADELQDKTSQSPCDLGLADGTETWLEIGFGGGEHVIGLLKQHPNIQMLAAEPFLNGMASFVKDLPKHDMPRVKALMDDGMLLARCLSESSISRIYVLNPDPWHKKRHFKRRIINLDNLDVFARILKPGGKLIMTSDVLDLADWMMTHAYQHSAFEWDAQTCTDWNTPPQDWITTRYETKGAKGAKKMCYLSFTRK